MAGVTVSYKGNVIAEMGESGTKTINAKETYCEDNIIVNYESNSTPSTPSAPVNSKSYEITLAKASGWVLLTTLDAEVLAHINDANLVVTLVNMSAYAYEWYAGDMFIVCNKAFGRNGSYSTYGSANREASESAIQQGFIYYPANYNSTDTGIGGHAIFRVDGDSYYLKPGDGFIKAGTYKLTFAW